MSQDKAIQNEQTKVFVRVRGLTNSESTNNCKNIVEEGVSPNSVAILDPLYYYNKNVDKTIYQQTFRFDGCLLAKSDQKDVFEMCGRPLLEDLQNGYNSTFLGYGQTSSGKTYTILGTKEYPGLLRTLCTATFTETTKRVTDRIDGVGQAWISVSFIEIYNEKVFDLFAVNLKTALKVREKSTGEAFIPGLSIIPIETMEQLEDNLKIGQSRRATTSTLMNSSSSRSHAIFTLYLEQQIGGTIRKSQVKLVDLAGSEKSNLTGATGVALSEANAINKSLSTLGDVINALREKADQKRSFIPYRNSPLTWLLKEVLDGAHSKITFLACISPTESCYAESISTLRYVERTKMITTSVSVNDYNAKPSEVEINALKDTVYSLTSQLSQAQKLIASLQARETTMQENELVVEQESGDTEISGNTSLCELSTLGSETIEGELRSDVDLVLASAQLSTDTQQDTITSESPTGISSFIEDSTQSNSQDSQNAVLKEEGESNLPVLSDHNIRHDMIIEQYSRDDVVKMLIESNMKNANLLQSYHQLMFDYKNLERDYCQTKLKLAEIVTKQ